jgi:AAA+ superfamily predicted ATPase
MDQPARLYVGSAEWCRLNEIVLRRALRPVREALERHLGMSTADSEIARDEPEGTQARRAQQRIVSRSGEDPPLERICTLFGLNRFEREVLALATAVELDPRWRKLVSTAHGNPELTYPTPGLVLAALDQSTWTAFVPSGPLRRWRLIQLTPDDAVLTSRLRLDERVFHYLVAGVGQEESIAEVAQFVEPPPRLVASHQAVAERIERACRTTAQQGLLPIIELRGRDPAEAADVAAAVCARLGLSLARVAMASVPTSAVELERFMRIWEREALLSRLALLLDAHELDTADTPRVTSIQRLLEGLNGLALIAAPEPVRLDRRPVVGVRVGRPTSAEQRAVWEHGLGVRAPALAEQIDLLTGQFDLSVARIRAACLEVETELASSHNGLSPEDLGRVAWDACRVQAQPRLAELAERVDVRATWDELIVPDEVTRVLRQICAHVRQRSRVYTDWQFASRSARGLGISALFAGPSGTGKTMAAEVLAAELRLDLYRIDLSATVSKYIGETEKNLRRVFDAAEEGGAVLLFDEADALFGKRSEVKDSHDRYANVEVSYLLQRMEAYRGLAILTTNLEKSLDSAFIRRIRFIVRLPFPTAAQRSTMWHRVFPPATPLEELDLDRLASLNVTGGTIRNIALNAAMLAADEDAKVSMKHLASAAHTEFEKLRLPQPGLMS